MRSPITPAVRTASTVSEYALSRQAQAQQLAQADLDREEQRRLNDARIDPNASKWRYAGA